MNLQRRAVPSAMRLAGLALALFALHAATPHAAAAQSLLDARHWYVMANFREAEIRHMTPGTVAQVYLLSAPDRRFRATVQGISWAVKPEGEIDLPHSVPYVKPEGSVEGVPAMVAFPGSEADHS